MIRHPDNLRKCSERLGRMRYRNRKTLCCIADQIGFCKESMRKWENGKQFPPADALIELASLYHCSVDYILGRTDDPA